MNRGRIGPALWCAAAMTLAGATAPGGMSGAAAAPQKFAGEKPRTADAATLGDYVLAKKLFRFGERTGDAASMYNAARIVDRFERRKGDAIRQRAPGAEAASAPEGDRGAAAMFSAAKKTAGDDATLSAEIDKAAAGGDRAAARGGLDFIDFELSGQAVEYLDWELVRGEYYELAIEGDGSGDVDLEVYDPAGNLVCSSTGDEDIEYCRFRARSNGVHTVVITNYGNDANWIDLMWWI